jgi:hypothetical protein
MDHVELSMKVIKESISSGRISDIHLVVEVVQAAIDV